MVFCNQAEALEWGQCEDIEAAIAAIKQVARRFVITLGAEGAITWDGDQHSIAPSAHTGQRRQHQRCRRYVCRCLPLSRCRVERA